jgi:hypothetical protein
LFLPWYQGPSFAPIQHHTKNYSPLYSVRFFNSTWKDRSFWTEW